MSNTKNDKNQEMTEDTGDVREIPVSGDEDESAVEPVPVTDPVEALKARVAELDDLRLRALAEVDNTRKRLNRQMDDLLRTANERILVDLLEVVDNFDRALKHTNGEGESKSVAPTALKEGTELIYNQLLGLLSRYEVRPMDSVGRRFDPTYHEALAHIESAEYEEGTVAAEINRGYMIGARVLRHARVAVSKGTPKAGDAEMKDNEVAG
jgi:molecular chaperone GrpE